MKLEDISKERLDRLKAILKAKGLLEEYVILRERSDGRRYIEYAFRDGSPEENECLSWHIQPHPKTKERYDREHDGLIELWKCSDFMVGHICRLSANVCGPDSGCKIGKPAQKCLENGLCPHWTKEEPVKCACWDLDPVKSFDSEFKFTLTIDEILWWQKHQHTEQD